MEKNKLSYNGYECYMKTKDLYYFSKKDTNGKYLEIICTENDMKNGNIEFMCQHDLTLIPK